MNILDVNFFIYNIPQKAIKNDSATATASELKLELEKNHQDLINRLNKADKELKEYRKVRELSFNLSE